MPLQAGSRLGPFEVLTPVGTGAMGEVYRARDGRLGRDVAVKVLPLQLSQDRDSLRRFEQEARAASALNHPNLVTVYDIGSFNGTSYIAMELVDGTTLRALLNDGALPLSRALAIGAQIADGLAAAHPKGLVHRDLKPQNLMVSRDGRVKILDFGLAKLVSPIAAGPTEPTEVPPASLTTPGTILGTVGYMAPEQARGQPADYRADQFSLGAILYEMVAGRRAFEKQSAVETLSAILSEEPDSLPPLDPRAQFSFCEILQRCLAKDPEERYGSTRDLARDLKELHDHLVRSLASAPAMLPVPSRRRRTGTLLLAGVAVVGGLIAGVLVGTRISRHPLPVFRQLTFRRGTVWSARFAQGGQTVAYGAAWDGGPFRLFRVRPENPDSHGLEFPDANLLAVSASGEMLAAVHCRGVTPGGMTSGMLAQAPLEGGTPREILSDVLFADWAPGGNEVAVVRSVPGKMVLEFPLGRRLYETAGFISHPRVSPRGDFVAFLDHPTQNDDSGEVAVVDRAGRRRTLSGSWASAQGLAWEPDGKEVWFAATAERESRSIWAVSLSGKKRLVARVAGNLTLQDISADGRVLATRETRQFGIVGRPSRDEAERDLSWLDSELAMDISNDGKSILFAEFGEAVDSSYASLLRRMDRSPPKRLGAGFAQALSPDGQWALSIVPAMPPKILLLPTGAGQVRELALGNLIAQRADWSSDGRSVVIAGSQGQGGVRLFLLDPANGKSRPVTPEGMRIDHYQGFPISADGKWLAAVAPNGALSVYPLSEGDARPIPGLGPDMLPIRWSPDGRSLLVFQISEVPARIFRVNPFSGEKELWRELPPPSDPTGIHGFPSVQVTSDWNAYAYSYARFLSELYLVDGLK
jgi:eukaryotic-like serine/threonine-protein kinase